MRFYIFTVRNLHKTTIAAHAKFSTLVYSPISTDVDRSRAAIRHLGSEAVHDMGAAILDGDVIWCQSARELNRLVTRWKQSSAVNHNICNVLLLSERVKHTLAHSKLKTVNCVSCETVRRFVNPKVFPRDLLQSVRVVLR